MRRALPIVVLLAGCTDYELFNQKHTDFFQQNQKNVVDVLLVVDNSCSMIEEQTKLATNFDAFIQYFQGAEVDYQLAVITTDTYQDEFIGKFVGGDDEIILNGPTGALVDRVTYDRDWTIPTGTSLQLDADSFSQTSNDVQGNWCSGSAAYGDGDMGTPGDTNVACTAGFMADDTGSTDTATDDTGTTDDSGTTDDTGTTDTGGSEISGPSAGDILITEFMADPAAVEDSVGEWVELFNTTDETLSLASCTLEDSGRNAWTFPDTATIASGQYLVIGRESADNGGISADHTVSGDFTLNNSVTVITPDTDSASEVFAEMVAQGISGSGIEMGLEAARLAFGEELLAGTNAGFLREEANLSFIFVSDEDDDSPWPVDDYLRFFTELKGEDAFRDHKLFNISAVVGENEPQFSGEPSCSSADGTADYGLRYVDLANRTDGVVESICDEDFSPLAAELGLVLSGLAVEFELSERPDVTTIEIALYETDDEASFVRDLIEGEDWVYILERNSVRFEEGQVPPPEWYISVEYELLATGAEVNEDQGGEE